MNEGVNSVIQGESQMTVPPYHCHWLFIQSMGSFSQLVCKEDSSNKWNRSDILDIELTTLVRTSWFWSECFRQIQKLTKSLSGKP